MKKLRHQKREILDVCDEIGEDDGISPKETAKQTQAEISRQKGKSNHRVRQLCKQTYHAIDSALACDCGDPMFDDLRTVWVSPAGGGSSLEVTFTTALTDLDQIDELHRRLNQVRGVLRSAVAGSINRKRVPSLRFRIVPARKSG